MLCSTKVQNTDTGELDKKENMLRMVQNISASRGLFLEPYVSSLQAFANYASATQKSRAKLPKQPVPKLKDTLDKYLRSVQPFLNVKQMRKTTSLVRDFEQGLGSKLQVLLEKRAEEHENWLEDWWLATAYLEYRDPVVVHSSPGLLLPFGTIKNSSEQLEFAAKILLGSLEYKAKIDSDQYPQDMMGKTPLDMGQYKKIFGTCRIPLEKRDKLVFHSNSRHIIVLHNDHIFRVDLWGKDNVQLNASQIIEQLKIVMDNSPLHNENGVGILTSEHRDNWAKSYQILMKDPKNQEFMKDVHESLVALCLDAPCGYLETAKPDYLRSCGGAQTIHGGGSKSNGGNRWFDKTIQFIVGAEGLAGMSYEHSPAEGQPIAILTDFLIEYAAKHNDSAPPSKNPTPPKYLDFKVTPELQPLILQAENNLDTLADNLFLHCFKFQNFGKGFIKSQKLSPDSFIQMAMQYAFYRLHREPGAHYESAATRMYKGGRTETIRSCSVESIEFAKTMLNPIKTAKDKIEALKNAINSHKNYTVQALQGLGVDRHLLGLKLIAQANGIELHDLYKDISYTKSAHMRISTSQVAFKSEAFMCYGPLVNNGYATCYNPRENDIIFGISAFKDDPDTALYGYKEALVNSLEDMHNLFVQNTPSKL